MSLSNMSLFIPRVFLNIDEERIRNTFEKLMIGEVSRIDFVLKMDKYGSQYNAVYVHFSHWYNNSAALNLQTRIREGNEAKVVYDDPWYWIVLENKGKKQVLHGRRICIDLSEKVDDVIRRHDDDDVIDVLANDNNNVLQQYKKLIMTEFNMQIKEFEKNITELFDTNNYLWLNFCSQYPELLTNCHCLTPRHVRARIDEIIEKMEDMADGPNRKEIERLGAMSKELSFLKNALEEYDAMRDEEMDREAEQLLDEMENAESHAEADYIMNEMCYSYV